MRFLQALCAVSILCFATPVLAQVENGDFEMPDGDGWRVVVLTGSGATGKANVSMGGGPNSSYTSGNSGTTPWTRVTIGGAGRNHFLSVGLRVLANAQWEISYDNFTSTCLPGVAVEPSTWGRIKAFRY